MYPTLPIGDVEGGWAAVASPPSSPKTPHFTRRWTPKGLAARTLRRERAWEAEGISRRTWFRRRKSARTFAGESVALEVHTDKGLSARSEF